jgi:hypothetical protein
MRSRLIVRHAPAVPVDEEAVPIGSQAILELIGRLALTIDGRDWNALGQLFTDTVYHDRTSLTGAEPTTLGVAEFVDGSWRRYSPASPSRSEASCCAPASSSSLPPGLRTFAPRFISAAVGSSTRQNPQNVRETSSAR